MSKQLSRRGFLERLGLSSAAATLPILRRAAADSASHALPHRTLGRTGASVSVLAFGCGSRFLIYEEEEKGLAALNRAIDLGINYPDRTRDDFMRRLEGSLRRLQTDHVDLVHIHGLGHAEDLAKIEAPDGAMKGLLEAREQKMARFVGMTSHTDG